MHFTKKFITLCIGSLFSAVAIAQDCDKCKGDACCATTKEAQEYGYYAQPYGFVQIQGGVNTIFSPGKQFNPTFSIAGGYMFSPAIGARLHVNGYEAKNGFGSIDDTYKFKYVNTDFDILLNLTNLFRKTRHNAVDLYLVAGTGLLYAWDNKEFNAITASKNVAEDHSNAWGKGKTHKDVFSNNMRAGLMLDFNLAKNWSLGAEVDINHVSDRFDSKWSNSCDWYGTAQLSLTYKFGHKKCEKPAPAPEPAPKPVVAVPAAPVAAPAPKPEPKVEPVKEEPLHEVMTFAIRESCPLSDAVINKCKAWLAKYPNKNLTVSAYADKGTGNAKLNMKYSEQRKQSVVKGLIEAGIPAERIDAKAYGDTVQPFAENDANRCAIIDGVE